MKLVLTFKSSKMKKKRFSYAFLLTSVILLTTNCSKDDNSQQPGPVPVLSTSSITSIKGTTATCGGNITADNGLTVTARGICWSTNSTPTISDDTTCNSVGAGGYTSKITGLNPKTQYFVRAYATSSAGTGYGSAMSFTTTEITRGENYQGGIVCYIFTSVDPGYVAGQTHGYIAAPVDQSASAEWGCFGTLISGLTGTGKQNTITIMNNCSSAGIAARLCADLVLGGYDDWYLPNYGQAQHLQFLENLNLSTSDHYYWTSSQIDSDKAMYAIVGNAVDNPYVHNKNNTHPVRAFRDF